MTTRKLPVEMHATVMICDDCGVGEMIPTGVFNWSHADDLMYFEHKCGKCGAIKVYTEKYPLLGYFIIREGS